MHSFIEIMHKNFLTIREAAKMLGVSLDTLRRWDKSGILSAVRLHDSSHRLYRKEDIDILLSDLFAMAKEWCFSSDPAVPSNDFYCENSAVFQSRLGRMEDEFGKSVYLQEVYPLLVALSGEIGNNSFDHNLGNWPDIPGIFFGYDLKNSSIVLADRGQGILVTLKRVRSDLSNDSDALNTAFTEVVSGRAPEARGNGLKFVRRIISGYPFSLVFQTGNARLEMQPENNDLFISETAGSFHGCIAFIRFNLIK